MRWGRRDILRARDDGPFLRVAHLRVIIAGVLLALIEVLLFSAFDEDGRLRRDMSKAPAEAPDAC